jgi:hypothetical protein
MSNDHQQVQRRSGVEPMSPNHNAALAFLNPGSLCDPCLAEQLELSGMDVTMTTLNIEEQQTPGILVALGYCKRCRRMDR